MNLDFLDVLSQPNQKHREQVGTAGTGCIHASLSVPNTSPATGNSGNKIPAPTANAETCSHVFPVYSQNMGTERPNVDAAVPAVPGVPNENGQLGNAETGVLAEQETGKKHPLRWLDNHCAWSQGVWGSESSLYQDYREWCSEYNQPPCSRELFCAILNEWFQRDSDGWQGLCIAADWRLSESEINAQIRFGQTALRLDQMWAEKEELRLRLQNDEDATRTSAGEVSSDERNLNPHCDRPFDGAAKILFQLRRLYSLERDPIVLRGRDTWDNIGRSVLASILAMRRRLLYPKSSMPTVSVIVVLRNKIHLSILCLCSLLLETDVDYELIIVDNGSSDETTAVLSLIDSATIIRNVDNLGFGPAVMQGASRASGEFLCLLNNDALLQRGSLAACLRVFSGRSDTGAVGGKVLLADGLLQEAGCIVWRDGRTLQYGRGQDPWLPQFNFRRPVDYCSGVFLITPRLLFQTLGGLDDRYSPAYFEDTDYCMKLWAAGRPVIYEPKSVVHHYEGASSSKFATTREAIAANHLRFTDRWRSVLRTHRVESSQNVLRARIAARSGSRRCLYFFGHIPDPVSDLWSNLRTQDVRSLAASGAGVTVLFAGGCNYADLQVFFGTDVELRKLDVMETDEIGHYCAASDLIVVAPGEESNHDITELLSSHKARVAPEQWDLLNSE